MKRIKDMIEEILKKTGLLKLAMYKHILTSSIDISSSSMLDLGCGKGEPMRWIAESLDRKEEKSYFKVGVDLNSTNLKIAKGTFDCCVCADIQYLPFKEKSFDLLLLLDALSYLKKKAGLKVLKEIEGIARIQLIVFTPIGVVEPDYSIETKYERYKSIYHEDLHKSCWYPSEFRRLGYIVRGVNGLRFLRIGRAKIRFSGAFRPFALVLSFLSQVLLYYFPKGAFQMLCVKSLANGKIPSSIS